MPFLLSLGAHLLGLRSVLSRAWGWITASLTHLLLVALAGVFAWGWLGHHEAAKFKRVAAHEHAGRLADHAAYVKAQQDALAKALAAKQAQEARYKEQADEADRKAQEATVDANSRLAEYIRTHRLPAHVASPSGGPGGPAQGDSAPRGDGPRSAPELVAVTPDDLAICTTNTTRLEAVRDWALRLGASEKAGGS